MTDSVKDNDDRPSWDEYFTILTEETSKRSPCKRLKVGCIFVNDNRIISQGYNGYLPGCPHEQILVDGHEIATIHAEQNAIIDCAKRGVSSKGCTAYISHFPCYNCTKMMCAAGIIKIKYIKDYNNNKFTNHFANLAKIPIEKLSV